MYEAAQEFLDLARERNGTSRLYRTVASIAFSAFCLEGFLNHLGSQQLTCWKGIERRGPRVKLSRLAGKSGVSIDWDKDPWKSFPEMFEIRNTLAHPRMETYTYETADLDDALPEPRGKLQDVCTVASAENILVRTKEIINQLWRAFGNDGEPLTTLGEFESIGAASRSSGS